MRDRQRRPHGRLLIVHEAPVSGGLGGEIIATVMEKAGDRPVHSASTCRSRRYCLAPAKMEPYSMIEPSRVVNAVRNVMED